MSMSEIDDLPSDNNDQLESIKQNGISLIDDDGKKKSQSTLMIEIGSRGKLFHDDNNDAYSEIVREHTTVSMKIRSREFVEYLSYSLFSLTGKGASATAITDAKNTLESKAKFDGELKVVAIRTYKSADNIYIDLGCDTRRVIEISTTGWKFVDDAPIKFVRKKGMTSLPVPISNGSLGLLKKYLNVSECDYPLIIGWMFCALGAVKPYPILILQGEQGTGKSVSARVIRSLIDPSSVPLRTPPKDMQNLLVSAANTHLVSIDNLSGLKPEIADCLCRLSTGGGIDVRALYTDDEQHLVDIQKPTLINGIDDIASRPDLAERSIILNLPVIPEGKRKTEREFWAEFEKDKPLIFAGLLDGLVSGLNNTNSLKLENKPRMADVVHWVTSCEIGIGVEGEFLDAHAQNQQSSIEANIEASPIGAAIKELMNDRRVWSGTPTQLLAKLEEIAGERQVRSRAWVASLKGMNNVIKRLLPSFRKIGIEITKKETHNREYILENVGKQVPQPHKAPIASPVDKIFGEDGAVEADKSQEFSTDSKFRGEI